MAKVTIPSKRRYDLGLQLGSWHFRPLRGGPDGFALHFAAEGSAVTIQVLATGAVTAEDLEWCIEAGRGMAGLDDDPSAFDAVAKAHPLVEDLHRRFPGVRLTRTPTLWECLFRTVIEQLVTSQEAMETRRRIWRRWGEQIGDSTLFAAPRAEIVSKLTSSELRPFGLGQRRAVTAIDAARRGARLEALRDLAPELAMKKLQSLRGIGGWTANMVAIHAFAYADGILTGDSGAPFVTTLALTGEAGGDEEMASALEPFRPHRARVHRLLSIGERFGLLGIPPRQAPRVDPHRRMPWRY